MSAVRSRRPTTSSNDEIEISAAALSSYGRLLRAVGRRILIHVTADGELICEDRLVSARPTLWRISRDGTVVPDRPYSYRRRAFVATELPFRGCRG